MAKVYEVCEIKPATGNNVSQSDHKKNVDGFQIFKELEQLLMQQQRE